MSLASINVKFSADLRGFSSEMQNSIRKINQYGRELQSVGNGLSLYLTTPLLAAGAASVKFASDYQESLNKVDVAFGDSSAAVREFAKESLTAFGISEGTALDMAATFGDMATSLGLPVDRAADMSKSLVGLAGDLASFKNISIDIANTALTGVFSGETESLKKLGIVMTETNLQAFALSQGITKQFKDFSQAEKVQLRYAYILANTKNAQGDFARTGGGAANQTRIFTESLKQVGQQLGSVILPAFTKAITFVNGLIKSFSDLSSETKTTIVVIAGIAAAIGPLLSATGALLTFIPNLITKFNALKDAFSAMSALIAANPYTALAVAIAAIAAGFALWYSNQTKVVTAQQSLNTAIANGNKAALSEVSTLDRLYKSSTDVKLGIDERKAAYQRLQELYPAYFKNIDFENLKNAQSVGIYKELRQAIFDKSKAAAIGNELDKRAQERLEGEIERQQKIQKIRERIIEINKGGEKQLLAEGSISKGTADVYKTKNELLATQYRFLKQIKQEQIDADALAQKEDRYLLGVKSELDQKSAKLTENEIARQKAIIAQTGVQVEAVGGLKVGTIAYYESLIELARKAQREVATNSTEFDILKTKIDGYQKQIDAISKKGIKIPKPEIPNADSEGVFIPTFSLEDLENQISYYRELQSRFSNATEEGKRKYQEFEDLITGTQLVINDIKGTEKVKTTVEDLKSTAVSLQEDFNAAIESTLEGFASGIGEAIAGAFNGGSLLKGFNELIFSSLGNMLIQLGKIAISTGTAIEAIKKALTGLKGFGAIAAGVALIALGSIVKSQVANIGAFADGGIVGGSSFYGDRILARVNSGELILNDRQQRRLYNQLERGGGTVIPMVADVTLKGSDLLIAFNRAKNQSERRGE
jgi:hypothetical protein